MWLPAVVRTPSVQNRSLIASGMPSSGPALPSARRASAGLGLRQRLLAGDGDEGIQPRVQRGDAVQVRLGQLDGVSSALVQRRRRRRGEVRSVGAASLDHLGHGEEVAHAALGRVGQHLVGVPPSVTTSSRIGSATAPPPAIGSMPSCSPRCSCSIQPRMPFSSACQRGRLGLLDGCGRARRCGGRSRVRGTWRRLFQIGSQGHNRRPWPCSTYATCARRWPVTSG